MTIRSWSSRIRTLARSSSPARAESSPKVALSRLVFRDELVHQKRCAKRASDWFVTASFHISAAISISRTRSPISISSWKRVSTKRTEPSIRGDEPAGYELFRVEGNSARGKGETGAVPMREYEIRPFVIRVGRKKRNKAAADSNVGHKVIDLRKQTLEAERSHEPRDGVLRLPVPVLVRNSAICLIRLRLPHDEKPCLMEGRFARLHARRHACLNARKRAIRPCIPQDPLKGRDQSLKRGKALGPRGSALEKRLKFTEEITAARRLGKHRAKRLLKGESAVAQGKGIARPGDGLWISRTRRMRLRKSSRRTA